MFQKVTNISNLPPGNLVCTLIEDPENPGEYIWFWQSREEFLQDEVQIRTVDKIDDPCGVIEYNRYLQGKSLAPRD